MLSLYDRTSMLAALSLPLDPDLHRLLAEHIAHLTASEAYDLTELTHFAVLEPGDSETDITAAIGLTPLVNPADGSRFGSGTFQPWWDHLCCHGRWAVMTIAVGNSGFAYILFIEDADGVDPVIRQLCRTYVG